MSKDSAKSPYLTLEELDLFGDMDSLPFSLDDPIWQDRDAAMAFLAQRRAKGDEVASHGSIAPAAGLGDEACE
jgi:hypothetical protein